MDELSQYFPPGVNTPSPTTARASSRSRSSRWSQTLVEAVVLVFLVMYLFLQNFRYTLIPTIVVPVALLGTFAVMLRRSGFSINVLTMFGMVLAIGILVDDAIVVVENVERIMSEEGLPPQEATRKAMGQITGAIIGITLVLFCGVRADGVLRRLGRQHLPPVRAGDGGVDRVLGVPRAVADAGAVRHLAEAGQAGPPREERLLRLVQPRLRRGDGTATQRRWRGCCAAPAAFMVVYRRCSSSAWATCSCACRRPSCRTRTRAT